MCPYGRIQSVLMDDDSVTVAYDYNRGEPRKGTVSKPENEEIVLTALNVCQFVRLE